MHVDLAAGRLVGRYRLISQLGRGGFGVVWKAYDDRLRRDVAVKLLLPDFATEATFRDDFEREARAISRLDHPHILTVLDFGEQDRWSYMVSPYLGGGTLRGRLHEEPWRLAEAAPILEALASALDYAHGERLVHRDVKPENVLLTDRGRPVLGDFGLARVLESETLQRLTGRIAGTPRYMAPEQALGQHVGPAGDQYSLTILAFEMLTGRPPFADTNLYSLIRAHIESPPPPARSLRPDLPRAAEAALLRGLAKAPADRFPRCADLVAALTETSYRRATQPEPRADVRAAPTPARPVVEERPAADAGRATGAWFSRRRLLAGIGAAAVTGVVGAIVAASRAAQPLVAPATPVASGPPVASASARPSPTGAASTPAVPTTAAASAPAKPASGDARMVPGTLNVWFTANWTTGADEAIGSAFVAWGRQSGTRVEWQTSQASPQQLARESAALAAGQPPEICSSNRAYWYGQGELANVAGIMESARGKAGGIYDIALNAETAPDGGLMGVPYAIDVWAAHWRLDEIGPATGGKPFETWEQVLDVGAKVQKPPRTYAIALPLGHESDHLNAFCSVIWAYGGRLCTDRGMPDIANPANRAGIDAISRLWKAKVIPPDTFAQVVTSWNNATYQKGRGLVAINPPTIMGWLMLNDRELADKTGLAAAPAGPAGSFAEGSTLALGAFKKAKLAEQAAAALAFFAQPENLVQVSKAIEGRFVPVYRDHARGEFWERSAFAGLKGIAETARVREWPAPPQPWRMEVEGARYTVSDMLNKILNDGMATEDAQEWAQREMLDAHARTARRP